MVDAKRGRLHCTVAAQGYHYFPDRTVQSIYITLHRPGQYEQGRKKSAKKEKSEANSDFTGRNSSWGGG